MAVISYRTHERSYLSIFFPGFSMKVQVRLCGWKFPFVCYSLWVFLPLGNLAVLFHPSVKEKGRTDFNYRAICLVCCNILLCFSRRVSRACLGRAVGSYSVSQSAEGIYHYIIFKTLRQTRRIALYWTSWRRTTSSILQLNLFSTYRNRKATGGELWRCRSSHQEMAFEGGSTRSVGWLK